MLVDEKIDRAAAARARVPHSRPTLGPEDEAAVTAVLRSGMIRGGERLGAFESRIAEAFGRSRAMAVTSGSAALHLGLLAMNVGPGCRVAIPSYACISLLQAVRRAGAEPLLVDCDPATFLMDLDDARRRLSGGTKALVLVDTFGLPADPAPFVAMGIPVIVDAAASLGGVRDGKPAGTKSVRAITAVSREAAQATRPAGSEGVCAIGSFNANKMITTGGGGAVASDDSDLICRVEDLLDYDAREDPEVRFNERMGDLAAGLGLAQLQRLVSFVERRREIAALYLQGLSDLPVSLPTAAEGVAPSWHRFVIRVPGGSGPVREALQRAGIDSPRPIHAPIHMILGERGFPGAEAAHEEALSLPIFPSLPDEEALRVVTEVRRCIRGR